MRKRFLATLLAICLIVSMIPFSAAAEETNEAKIDNIEYATLSKALENATKGQTVELLKDVTVTSTGTVANQNPALVIDKAIILDGQGYNIIAGEFTRVDGKAINNILDVHVDGAVVKNLTIIGNYTTKSGINVYGAENVRIENVTVQDCGAAGVIVNKSSVTAKGLNTKRNVWGAVNVDPKGENASFTLDDTSLDDTVCLEESNKIWTEGNVGTNTIIAVPEEWESYPFGGDGKTYYTDPTCGVGLIEVNEKFYPSLEAALKVAGEGDTVTLSKGEFTVSNAIILDKKLTIQGSGEETVIIGGYVQDYGNGLFTFTGGSEGTVLKNMTIQYTKSGIQQAAVYFDYGFTGGSADEVTKIQNVHFIGGEGLDSIGGAMAIGSTYTTGGFVEISGCQIENFKYGMYFNAMHDLSITNNTIDGTSYNAINIAGDGKTSCENITIEGNVLKNISKANYEDDKYSSGIRVGLNASNVAIENNEITMLNGDKIYFDPVVEGDPEHYIITAESEGEEIGQYVVEKKENGEIILPEAPERDGYTFTGWKAENDNIYNAEQSVAVDELGGADGTITLTAQWTADSTPGGGGTEEPTEAEPFEDVDEDDWFYNDVVYVYENGLMQGTSDTAFSPKKEMDRAMLVTTLYRMEGEPSVADVDVPFTDITEGYYVDAVAWAYANNIVSGYENNTFQPGEAITREQYVTILHRYAQFKGMDVTNSGDLSAFTDAEKVSGWAEEAMTWAVDTELMQGVTETTIAPRNTAQRCQGAALLTRFHQMMA